MWMAIMLAVLISMESKGKVDALGKHGEVGCLQITPVMVDEVNRILRVREVDKRYKYIDRYDRQKSEVMAKLYFSYYKPRTPRQYAELWNGGPSGIKRPTLATRHYADRVVLKMEEALSCEAY